MSINVKSRIDPGEVFKNVGGDIEGVDLREADDSPTITVDSSDPDVLKFDVVPQLEVEAVQPHGAAHITSARLATVAALPACTYYVGTSGVGATLTGDANGALADIDFTTPALGDVVVVMTQANLFENGLYEVTQLGTVVGTPAPFILTRTDEADEAADYAEGIVVHVGAGVTQRGRMLISSPTTVVMGTTSIRWRAIVQPHLFRTVDCDFDEFLATVALGTTTATVAAAVPGTKFGATGYGAGTQITQTLSGAPTVGVASLETGSTAAGCVYMGRGHYMGGALTWDSAAPAEFFARVSVPTVSTAATQEFWAAAGLIIATIDPQRHHLTAGMYFEYPTDGTNIRAVNRTPQTAQTLQAWTRVTTTATFTVTSHGLQVGDPVTISATTDAAAVPATSVGVGYIVQSIPTANTFTVTCLNAGGASGTATVVRSTSTITDTGIASSATYRALGIRYNATVPETRFYIANSLVATHTTNLPAVVVGLMPSAAIQKQVGATSRSFLIDRIAARHVDPRGGMSFIPT